MLSSKFNFILTAIICIVFFVYIKSKSPKKTDAFDTSKTQTVEPIDLPEDHPLKHPKFKLIDIPSSDWSDGFIDIHDVLDYIFTTELEKTYALKRLLQAGYGQEKTNFLYFYKGQITINGYVFDKYSQAKLFLEKSTFKKIRVFILAKNEFPKELKTDGIYFYMIPWDKRTLPEIQL